MLEPLGDDALLEAWCRGDAQAGRGLLDRHFHVLYAFFAPRVGDATPDLIQRTLATCVELRERMPRSVSVRAYLLGIARNHLLHHLRKQARERRALERQARTPALHVPSPSAAVGADAEQRRLLRALRRLPLDMQLTIELFFWEELKIDEIAQVLEVAPGTVKSRLARAKDALRTELAREAERAPLRATLDSFERWSRALAEGRPRDRLA
jgi:RNA polymerase sigma factor (sigma-70 family)